VGRAGRVLAARELRRERGAQLVGGSAVARVFTGRRSGLVKRRRPDPRARAAPRALVHVPVRDAMDIAIVGQRDLQLLEYLPRPPPASGPPPRGPPRRGPPPPFPATGSRIASRSSTARLISSHTASEAPHDCRPWNA